MRRWWVSFLSVLILVLALPVPGALAATWPTLTSGTRGTDVYALQSFLQVRGYSAPVDEIFGSSTTSAVTSFQSANGLVADGIVGSGTWSKVVVTVQQGSSGQAVKALQRELNRKHHYGLTEDGIFGAGTGSAVKSFQSAHGLSADGIVGPATWQQLIGHFEDLGAASGTG
ncbi:MAG TPA: peptidoglycan-binding protein, partial [Symbiobacteriaceae bacterium]|nr:peptidoglycan-binding protein [Symbiobacteriaceae bacterium]